MNAEETKTSHPLESGQLWKLEHGYLHIVELGKRLIHYKLLRQPDQRAAITRLIRVEALLAFLSQNGAEMVGVVA
jgi:hypothetical protein